jgi:hypothetical protein
MIAARRPDLTIVDACTHRRLGGSRTAVVIDNHTLDERTPRSGPRSRYLARRLRGHRHRRRTVLHHPRRTHQLRLSG